MSHDPQDPRPGAPDDVIDSLADRLDHEAGPSDPLLWDALRRRSPGPSPRPAPHRRGSPLRLWEWRALAAGIVLVLAAVILHTGSRPTATRPPASRNTWHVLTWPSALGPDVSVAALSVHHGRLLVTLAAGRAPDGFVSSTAHYWSGVVGQDDRMAAVTPTGAPPAPAVPPVRLVLPETFPTAFRPVILRLARGRHVLPIRWPRSVPTYGSEITPVSAPPASYDTKILGQVGSWLWLALKGPQYPPLFPHQGPLVAGFRRWNRVVALNVATGRHRVWVIPATYTLWDQEAAAPSWIRSGSHVYIALGSWLGTFTATPTAGESISPPPSAIITQNGAIALADLRFLYAQEVNTLAAYWDSVEGTHVPGMPFYNAALTPAGWNTSPLIFNHGVYPADLVWALTYPFPAKSATGLAAHRLGRAITALLGSRLNADAWSPAEPAYAAVRAAFHDQAPFSTLPGYRLRGNVYRPDSTAVLLDGVPALPKDFPTYASVYHALTALLDLRSTILPMLPVPGKSLAPAGHSYLDVQYTVSGGAVPAGYEVTVSFGRPLPANAAGIQAGNAELDFATAGVPRRAPLPASLTWVPATRFPGFTASRIVLAPGVTGTAWRGLHYGMPVESVTWTEDGLTWYVPASPVSLAETPVALAKSEARALVSLRFPYAQGAYGTPAGGGYGIFAIGSDAPSEVVYHTAGGTYAVYATGYRAAALAALMNQ